MVRRLRWRVVVRVACPSRRGRAASDRCGHPEHGGGAGPARRAGGGRRGGARVAAAGAAAVARREDGPSSAGGSLRRVGSLRRALGRAAGLFVSLVTFAC